MGYTKKGRNGTRNMRHAQVGRLQDALPLETQAIEEIEKALTA